MSLPSIQHPLVTDEVQRLSLGRVSAYLIFCVLLAGLLASFGPELSRLPLIVVTLLVAVCVVAVYIAMVRIAPRGIWSVPAIYLAVFILFHFSLVLLVGLGIQAQANIPRYVEVWFSRSSTLYAITLACVGLTAFGIGVCLALLKGTRARTRVSDAFCNLTFTHVGFCITLACVCGWFLVVIQTGGVGLIFGSYESYLDAVDASTMMWLFNGMGIGMSFLASSRPSTLRRLGFLIFGLWMLIVLPLGLRGEVLFPSLTALIVIAKRKIPVSLGVTIGIVMGVLMLISFIRVVRQVGVSNIGAANVSEAGGVTGALMELGSSLRPVVEVVDWHEQGEPFIYGASFWAPIERQLALIIPGIKRVPGDSDERLMNVLVKNRVGAIGFSPVAEGYRNGGVIGVMLVMMAIGFIIGRMELWPATHTHLAAMGILFIPFFVEIRNAFTAVPFQLLLGGTVLYSAIALARWTLARPAEAAVTTLPAERT